MNGRPSRPWIIAALLAGLSLLRPAWAAAQNAEAEDDRTLAPYFFVQSDDPDHDRLPLKGTEVEVAIAGVIADVKVIQHYSNEGQRPIEARYVFPGSTRAAVYGLTLQVGMRRIAAEIREKQKAQAEYQQAKSEGKSAALLEQHRPNVFQMNVANILPGDDILVELHYTELLVPTAGRYQFVFPTVVGPRYSNQSAEQAPPSEHWVANPYLHAGTEPTSAFKLSVALNSGIALKEVSSSSHQIDVRYEGQARARIELAGTGQNENNRDFVLDYRLAGEQIESGVLLYQGADEKFFLAMVEPPKTVPPAMIPPRDYVFVVDVSGSMAGFPLDTAKRLLGDLIGKLRPTDSFNLLLFAGDSKVLAEQSLPANQDNIRQALTVLGSQGGGGATELLPALRRALALPLEPERSRSIVVVTDGYVTVEAEAFDLIRSQLNHANLFAFGIGSSVNRHLIEGMARVGKGEPFVVLNEQQAPQQAAAFRRYIEAPVLTHIEAEFDGLDVYDVEPTSIPDVFASRPILIFGKWHGLPGGRLILKGMSGAGEYRTAIDLSHVYPAEDNAALRYLWVRNRIATLSDYAGLDGSLDRIAEVTRLGLQYSLLTAYTSFIAVDRVVRNPKPGDSTTVDQPLPLPAGVSDLAVGGEVPATPEPETYLLLMASGLLLARAIRSRKLKV